MSDSILRRRRPVLLGAAALSVTAATALSAALPASGHPLPLAAKDLQRSIQGVNEAGGAGGETDEIKSALAWFNDARNAPGLAQEGGYTSALAHVTGMQTTPGTWDEVTKVPYNEDDHRYYDYYANTSGGASFGTGRVQALASSPDYVFAGGAAGGVFRKAVDPSTGQTSGSWELVSANVPALTTGALAYRNGELWLATGDGSSGGTTYSGDGVYVLSNADSTQPADGFSWQHLETGDPVGPNTGAHLFDGSVINQIRFSADGKWAYVATDYGVWRHSTDLSTATNWHPVFVPNPSALPGTTTNAATSATANYTSDVAVDPRNADHVVVAYGWVVGGGANGWYDVRRNASTGTWTATKSNVTGAINPKDIGRTTFAWAKEGTGSRLYALVHNPDHAATGVSYSELGGVYTSTKGVNGPWAKIADSQKLSQAGSALDPTLNHSGAVNGGYQPGVQAWYNQFLAVDPNNSQHVYVGLEEVYETRDAGAKWNTVAPYWNFYFPCWGSNFAADQAGCKVTPHSDQHAVTITDGRLFVGNDGGVYSRPVAGTYYGGGHGADWVSETKNDTPDLLQYYSVGVGRVNAAKVASTSAAGQKSFNSIVSGGLQDNGGSILFVNDDGSTEPTMGSNFGGDGGDVLVDPNDGCRIVQEYVDLSMRVTNTCAATSDHNAFLDPAKATTRNIAPPETSAQFISPFAADHQDINDWIAGGRHVWLNTEGFNISGSGDWQMLHDLGTNEAGSAGRQSTALAASGGNAIVGFCGSCSTGAFQSGYSIGKLSDPGSWTNHEVTDDDVVATYSDGSQGRLPSRFISGADVYTVDGVTHYLLAFNGFGRRWVEGPGAGVGHVFESTDGTSWTELDGSGASALPDVPTSSVKALADGRIVAGTDLGVFIRSADGTGTWTKLGDNLPATVVTDVEPGPGDGYLYAATYGRGIWRIPLTGLPTYAGGDGCQDTYWVTKQQPATACDGDVTTTATAATSTATSGGNGKGTGRR